MATTPGRPNCLLVCTAVLIGGCSNAVTGARTLPSLSVRELNIVDDRGQTRLRLGAPLPDPKGLKRALTIHGIQLLDSQGREVGGLALLDAAGINGLCFDTTDGYSPMCVGLVKGQPQVTLAEKGKERISLAVTDGTASLILHDAQGTPRLRLEVDRAGRTRIEGLSDSGPAGSTGP
jgi:hypothetical protein